MSQQTVKNIIEAALMVASQPLNVSRLLYLFEASPMLGVERNDIRAAVEELRRDYLERGIELVEVASGYRIQAKDDYAEWINRLFDERPPRYSRALLETLAIIAYRQPITRAEIEEIRGVSVSSTIIKTLQEREWIKVVGQRDVPGKPALLATTKGFLDYFNLKKLSDLPALVDIRDFDALNPDLFESLEKQLESTDTGGGEVTDTPVEPVDTESDTGSGSSGDTAPGEAGQAAGEKTGEDNPASAQVIPFNN